MTATSDHNRGAVMADWLDLHGLTPKSCRALLQSDLPQLDQAGSQNDPAPIDLPTTEEARNLCLRALADAFPDNPTALERLETETAINFSPDLKRFPRAFTLHNDGQGRPYISCPWRGQPNDFLTLAHELGHALQLVLSDGRDMPPVTRETCAYLSEAWLVEYLLTISHDTAAPLHALWQRRRHQVLTQGSVALRASLATPTAPYDYNWNYPLAHRFAARIQERRTPPLIVGFFANLVPLTSLAKTPRT